MIYYFHAFSKGNLGKGYNDCMQLLKDDDWAVFIDGDACFLANNHDQVNEIILSNQDVGLFTCVTNRVGESRQCFKGKISNDPMITNHYDIAQKLKKQRRCDLKTIDHVISGHFMAVKKSTWSELGGFCNGILGVDNDFSRKILKSGRKIKIMLGVYLFHYYRMNKGVKDKSHLL